MYKFILTISFTKHYISEGIFRGLNYLSLNISGLFFGKYFFTSIPILLTSYNRKSLDKVDKFTEETRWFKEDKKIEKFIMEKTKWF